MAAEPTEEAISSFISFTNSTRDQAIGLLKANDLNSNKAINAYFEGATVGPQVETSNYPSDQNVPSFRIEGSDPVPGTSLIAPPSRPPSRISTRASNRTAEFKGALDTPSQGNTDSDQKLSLAEREEHELQQAVAMSLSQNLGHQETGVTSTYQPNFGPATRDDYEEGNWSMTLLNSTSHEIIISPDPEDRKRVDNEPAFLRPSPDNVYLGGLITILHSIPLAREALLLRSKVLSNYGHDSQWWNGQPINLPKIVTIHDGIEGNNNDWDDILYETQRLVAFLDSTTRAFGSTDALAGLRCFAGFDSESNIGKFLQKWQEAAVCADPGNQLSTVFSSMALRQSHSEYDEPLGRDFTALETLVQPEHGQTLYDVLDQLMWEDRVGEELDDVWLEHVAEILTIKIGSLDSSQPVDVKIPPVFYPDRYLASCRDLARDFRLRKLQIYEDISKIDKLIKRFTCPKSLSHKGLTSREILDQAADAVPVLLNNLLFTEKPANLGVDRLQSQFRAISSKIGEKSKELELRRHNMIDALRNHCKLFTEPSPDSAKSPHHEYTLRGVCTEPHVTYILRRCAAEASISNEWQWWRISFSTDDAKARQVEREAHQSNERRAAPANADVIGYTARKVREVEVLHAAREQSKSVVLVYASKNALNIQEGSVPPQLQEFVNMDNVSFEEERQDANSAEFEDSGWKAVENMDWDGQTGKAQGPSQYPLQDQSKPLRGPANRDVNVFDYEVSSFDGDKTPAQEMQEKGGQSLLSQSNAGQSSGAMDTDWDEVDDTSRMGSGVKSME